MKRYYLFFYEPRGLYCVLKCEPDEILDRWKIDSQKFDSQLALLQSWRDQGFSEILVFSKGMEFLMLNEDPHHPMEELQGLEDLLNDLPLLKDYGGIYRMYKIPQS